MFNFNPFGIVILILVITLCAGSFSQCEKEQNRRTSELCFEQTKDIKCWELK